jgi:hypothetical protein
MVPLLRSPAHSHSFALDNQLKAAIPEPHRSFAAHCDPAILEPHLLDDESRLRVEACDRVIGFRLAADEGLL